MQTGLMFTNQRGDPTAPGGISSQLKVLAKKYRIYLGTVCLHSFWHRFAKNFLTKLDDISLLADPMDHESIETTRTYLTHPSDEQRGLIDRIITWWITFSQRKQYHKGNSQGMAYIYEYMWYR